MLACSAATGRSGVTLRWDSLSLSALGEKLLVLGVRGSNFSSRDSDAIAIRESVLVSVRTRETKVSMALRAPGNEIGIDQLKS